MALFWPQKEWFTDLRHFSWRKFLRSHCCGTFLFSPVSGSSIAAGDPPPSHLEVIPRLIRKAGFLRAVMIVIASDLRGSTAALYQGKWSRFLHWCRGWNLTPCKASVQHVAEFLTFLHHQVAVNQVFSLTGVDLAANTVSVVCSAASRNLVLLGRFGHRNGTFPWFYGVGLVHLLSPLSWLRTNTSPGRHTFYLLSRCPKGLVSCTASSFVCDIHGVGGPAPSLSFQTSLLRPRILQRLTPFSMNSPSRHWMTLLEVIRMNSCSALSEL